MKQVLVIPPIAGHTIDLVEDFVKTLEQEYDVVVADPRRELYKDYLRDIRDLIERHDIIIGICQGGAGLALALSQIDFSPANKQFVFIGAPLKPNEAPSMVSDFIQYLGAEGLIMRYLNMLNPAVVSGALITMDYMALDYPKHIQKLSEYIFTGDEKTKKFYTKYFAFQDMSIDFFYNSIDKIFIDNQVNIEDLTKNNKVLVIEGSKDNIVAPGQCKEAFKIGYSYIKVDTGHYGIFSGKKFREQIFPWIKRFLEIGIL